MEISLLLVAAAGLVVLVGLAVAVGTGLDTAVQRRAWRRVAEERRLLQQLTVRREQLCDRCPFRRPGR
jgi:hypothetical protein